jgi:hypothetical protein
LKFAKALGRVDKLFLTPFVEGAIVDPVCSLLNDVAEKFSKNNYSVELTFKGLAENSTLAELRAAREAEVRVIFENKFLVLFQVREFLTSIENFEKDVASVLQSIFPVLGVFKAAFNAFRNTMADLVTLGKDVLAPVVILADVAIEVIKNVICISLDGGALPPQCGLIGRVGGSVCASPLARV